MSDWELLQNWAASRSETAFAELVRRHLHLVYGSAVRQLADPELARDVTQAVFLVLSRKAPALKREVILSGWLFRTTCHVAARASRAESRRRRRETEATIMKTSLGGTERDAWAALEPEVDSALPAPKDLRNPSNTSAICAPPPTSFSNSAPRLPPRPTGTRPGPTASPSVSLAASPMPKPASPFRPSPFNWTSTAAPPSISLGTDTTACLIGPLSWPSSQNSR